MKCQKCTKAATLHTTEVLGEDSSTSYTCARNARKNIFMSRNKRHRNRKAALALESEGDPTAPNRECPIAV